MSDCGQTGTHTHTTSQGKRTQPIYRKAVAQGDASENENQYFLPFVLSKKTKWEQRLYSTDRHKIII